MKEKKLAGDRKACKIKRLAKKSQRKDNGCRKVFFFSPTIATKHWKYASNFRLTAEVSRSNFPIPSLFHRLLLHLYKNKDSTKFNELVCLNKRTQRSAEITRICHDKRRGLLIIQRQIPTLTHRRPGRFVYFGHASKSKFNLARKKYFAFRPLQSTNISIYQFYFAAFPVVIRDFRVWQMKGFDWFKQQWLFISMACTSKHGRIINVCRTIC